VFSARREDVAFIPQSALYMLAEPKADDVRDDIISELRQVAEESDASRVKVRDVKQALKETTSIARQAKSGIDATDDGCTVDDLTALADSGAKFGCIYADPPWVYGNQATRASTGNHYDGLTVEELIDLPVNALAADNAHLHLWTTNAFLFDCQRIMEAWGFTYKSCYVWVKPQMGMGNYWRVSHEFMLFGVRGKCPFGSHSEMSWGQYNRTIHSAKPEQIRHKIERVSKGPYLEMFGRRPVDGWTVWGNQISRDMLSLEVKCG
jgi:N6-adenosine-specific RNA methylase IME4